MYAHEGTNSHSASPHAAKHIQSGLYLGLYESRGTINTQDSFAPLLGGYLKAVKAESKSVNMQASPRGAIFSSIQQQISV